MAVVLVPNTSSPVAAAVAANTPEGCAVAVAAVAAGWTHSLVFDGGGRAYGTGYNTSGELGDGTPSGKLSLAAVTGLPAGVSAAAVSAGGRHSLVLGSDGRAYATGYNGEGGLGDGTRATRLSLVAVTGLPAGVSAAAVSAGGWHSLVLGSDGRAYGAGYNGYGELGDGTTTDRLSLVAVTGLPAGVAATAVSAGRRHSLVLGSDGRAYAAGSNANGQLGDGTTTDRSSLAAVTGLPAGVSATAISAGEYNSMVLGSDGRPFATGLTRWDAGSGSATRTAVVVPGLPAGVSATAVSAGVWHSLVLGSDGRAYAIGGNSEGALGDSTTTDRSSFVAMAGLPAGVYAAAVSAGRHSLVLGSDGRAYGAGYNGYGELGDGTTANRSSLVRVECPMPPYGGIVLSIDRGRDYGMLAWAIDPETGAPPLMRVTIEGVLSREYEWNYQWADMPVYTGANDNRSLVFLAQLPPGTRNVCFDALDPQGGGWTNLGCRTHTVK